MTRNMQLDVSKVISDFCEVYNNFVVLEDSFSVTEKLFNLVINSITGGKQIHDANIVASACRTANYALLLDFWRKLSVNYE